MVAYRCIEDFIPKDLNGVAAKNGQILLESNKTPEVDLPRDEFCFVENQSNGQFGYIPFGNIEEHPDKDIEIDMPLQLTQQE